MLKMRLQRIGRKNSPTYRVLVVDSRQGPKSGSFIDQIGTYEPKSGTKVLNGEKAREWLKKGVQASGTVHNMLISEGIIEGKKINVLPRKSPPKVEGSDATVEAPAPAPEAAPEASAPETAEVAEPVESAPAEETAETPEEVKA